MGESGEPGAGAATARGDRRPLSGVVALVTRAREQADALSEPLESLGARVILTPAIRFEDPADWRPADEALRQASSYDWAIFTSANGVEAVSRRLEALRLGWQIFSGVRLVAIGPATAAALENRGLRVSIVPEVYQAEGLLAALQAESVAGRRILLARAERARDVLPDELRRSGAEVDVVAVYRTAGCPPAPEAIAVLERREPAEDVVVIFTSSSTVTHFLEDLSPAAMEGMRAATLAAIGPITADELTRLGWEPAIVPSEFTIPALVQAIRDHFMAQRNAHGRPPSS